MLYKVVAYGLLKDFTPIRGQVFERSRYAEDLLEEALYRGINQYVILSAGMDSFGLRSKELANSIQIFEVDHPQTQERKKELFKKAGILIPAHLKLVPVDFERERFSSALEQSGYKNERAAFFSWLGTTPYLSEEAIFSTLQEFSEITATGE